MAAALNISESWSDGIWGPVTATLDWCEVNYQFSRYIAEMANTFSNLYSISLALHGVFTARSESLPTRYVLGSLGFMCVGIGSFAFHATMLYQAQLADELPMIFVASYANYVMFNTNPHYDTLSRRGLSLVAALLGFNVLFTWSYIIYRNPLYHQVVFAILMLSTAARVYYLLRLSDASKQIPDPVRLLISALFVRGLGLFALGFFIWNLDNIFCTTLTRQKVAIGWPIAFLLEGHAWWHVLTGTGTQLMLVGINYLTVCVTDDHRKYSLAYALGLPYVKRVSKAKAQ
jgi:dihydroceramidase